MKKKLESCLLLINFQEINSIVKGSALNAVEGKDEATGKYNMELMKAVDETIPQPNRPKDKPFYAGRTYSPYRRGTVVTGK